MEEYFNKVYRNKQLKLRKILYHDIRNFILTTFLYTTIVINCAIDEH